jgi:2-amino-4-hydroxy-6-hydroxymethyldihydropteridine diphosphokinase
MKSEQVSVYLGLGSNIGDRSKNLQKALEILGQRMKILEQSSVYDTEPVGNQSQPRFLNMVVHLETYLEPDKLLALLKGIEVKMGRVVPSEPCSPRPIDLDILFYGNRTWDSPALTIPHPAIATRAFVLVPLNEIAPEMVHPVTKKTICKMLKELNRGVQGILKFQEDSGTVV